MQSPCFCLYSLSSSRVECHLPFLFVTKHGGGDFLLSWVLLGSLETEHCMGDVGAEGGTEEQASRRVEVSGRFNCLLVGCIGVLFIKKSLAFRTDGFATSWYLLKKVCLFKPSWRMRRRVARMSLESAYVSVGREFVGRGFVGDGKNDVMLEEWERLGIPIAMCRLCLSCEFANSSCWIRKRWLGSRGIMAI
jgi:hypothetical protein